MRRQGSRPVATGSGLFDKEVTGPFRGLRACVSTSLATPFLSSAYRWEGLVTPSNAHVGAVNRTVLISSKTFSICRVLLGHRGYYPKNNGTRVNRSL